MTVDGVAGSIGSGAGIADPRALVDSAGEGSGVATKGSGSLLSTRTVVCSISIGVRRRRRSYGSSKTGSWKHRVC
jgi:hypothetical protein